MFGLQPLHLVVIVAVALIIFGPQRMPEIGRAFGKAIREFREATEGTQNEINAGLEARPAPRPQPAPVERIDQPNAEIAHASKSKPSVDPEA